MPALTQHAPVVRARAPLAALLVATWAAFAWRTASGLECKAPDAQSLTTGESPPLYQWSTVPFTFPAGREPAAGAWKKDECVPSGVKIWNGIFYVTFPRWHTTGVPITLGRITPPAAASSNAAGADAPPAPSSPPVTAYPDLDWQAQDHPTALQSVQDVEIDDMGRMWILDVGRAGILDPSPPAPGGAAKLVVWDIEKHELVASHTFSESSFAFGASFANDLVIDQPRGVAYMSDAKGKGGVVSVHLASGRERRFEDASFGINGKDITVDGNQLPLRTPVDGIALSPDTEWFYYCSLDSTALYRVPSATLRQFDAVAPVTSLGSAVQLVGDKGDATGGMVFSAHGLLYFGGMQCSAVYSWDAFAAGPGGGAPDPSSRRVLIRNGPAAGGDGDGSSRALVGTGAAAGVDALSWIDTLAFDGQHLVFTVTQLQKLLFPAQAGAYNMTPGAPPNFRIYRVDVGSPSYLYSAVQQEDGSSSSSGGGGGGSDTATTFAIIMGVLALVVTLAAVHTAQQLREARSALRAAGISTYAELA